MSEHRMTDETALAIVSGELVKDMHYVLSLVFSAFMCLAGASVIFAAFRAIDHQWLIATVDLAGAGWWLYLARRASKRCSKYHPKGSK